MQKMCFILQLFMSSSVEYELSFCEYGGFVWRGGGVCLVLVLFFDWLVDWFSFFLIFFFMCSICILIMITASLRLSFPAYDSTRPINILATKR